MKCLFLAAGYATRLYPLTENFPKPLLPIGDKPILDWLLDDLRKSGAADRYIVVSNHKFAHHFDAWAGKHDCTVAVLDDGSTCNENRLGAVKDILFAVKQMNLDDDLFILAGDNILDFSLESFLQYFRRKRTTCVMRYFEGDINRLHKTGVAEINDGDRIIGMEEKPGSPKSNWCIPPFYICTRNDLRLIDSAIHDGCGTDAPGSFIAWLSSHTAVHAFEMPGKRYDIGDLAGYEAIQKLYSSGTFQTINS